MKWQTSLNTRCRFVVLTLIVSTGNPVLAQQQTQSPDRVTRALQTELDGFVTREGIPGATLAVSFPDDRLVSLASGFADPDAQQRMPVGARMLVGSTGKTFVSAVALQLVSEKNSASVTTHMSTSMERTATGSSGCQTPIPSRFDR